MGEIEGKKKKENLLKEAIDTLKGFTTPQLSGTIKILPAFGSLNPKQLGRLKVDIDAAIKNILSVKRYRLNPVMFVSFKTRFDLKQKGAMLIDKKTNKEVAMIMPHKTDFGAVRGYTVTPLNPTPVMTKWFDKWAEKAKAPEPTTKRKGGIIQEL